MKQALCRDVEDKDIFFAERNESAKTNEAIMVCFTCPVRAECDEYRVRTNTKHGVWGGKHIKRE